MIPVSPSPPSGCRLGELLIDASFFCSWSGGKDSALALSRAKREGRRVAGLLTMLHENGRRSRSHGLSLEVLEAQAAAIGVPIEFHPATWDGYEAVFSEAIGALRDRGVGTGVFGDIDLEEHRQWIERVCGEAGMKPLLPLWGSPRAALIEELVESSFMALIVATRMDVLGSDLLGRVLDEEVVREIERRGSDACGENGEYHTVVLDGPIFSRPLSLVPGDTVVRDGYAFLDLEVGPSGR